MTMRDDAANVNWARYAYAKDRGHLEYMAQAQRCEGMYLGGGEQWTADDKAVLALQRRPSYEFNEVMPSVNAAIGYQIHNRMDIAFRPRGGEGDTQIAEVLSKIVMQICDQNKLHWHESQVFSDGLIEQRGYFDVRVSFDSNIKGEIQVTTLDPRDVLPDPDAKTYSPDGWSDVIVSRWLTADEIEQLYGRGARDKAVLSGDEGSDHGDHDEETERNKFGNKASIGLFDAYTSKVDSLKRYRIVDRQFSVYEKTKCIVLPDTGDVRVQDEMTPEQIAAALTNGAVPTSRMRKRIKWVVSTYSTVLFDAYSPYDAFTIIPFFSYFRRGKTRGMVDNAIGPQEALNKAVSQFVHIVNSAANSGWKIEENSLTNMDTTELEDVGAMTGLVLEYAKGSTPPTKIDPSPVPTGIDRLIDRATNALKDVTVPDAMRGNNSQEISGVAIQSRQFASQQQLAMPLDNLAYTRQLLANRILALVQRYYDSYRQFRITEADPATGKDTEKTIEINKPDGMGGYLNDITLGSYDVVISEQPMQITFENSQFTQALEMRKAGVQIPDATVLRYSNLSDKFDIMRSMTEDKPTNPLDEAKARLVDAQALKARTEATESSVRTKYSAMQAAQVIATVPLAAPLADKLLKSSGDIDHDAAPIIPNVPQQTMTQPTAPSPMTGVNDGIETARVDGIGPSIGE